MTRLVAVISLLTFSFNANAEWGQQWGSMVWGQSSTNVPMMGGFGQLIFFVLLLVIGVFVTKRWGLIKTFSAIAMLSLMPLMVDADEIELNTFQNGQVADADEVNENFTNLKQVVQELNETIKRVSCNAHDGVFLNDTCINPELDGTIELDNSVTDYIIFNIDTSSFEFESSSSMEIGFWSEAQNNSVANCNLINASSGIISTFTINSATSNYISNEVPIQDREMHSLSCTTTGPIDMEVNVAFD